MEEERTIEENRKDWVLLFLLVFCFSTSLFLFSIRLTQIEDLLLVISRTIITSHELRRQ